MHAHTYISCVEKYILLKKIYIYIHTNFIYLRCMHRLTIHVYIFYFKYIHAAYLFSFNFESILLHASRFNIFTYFNKIISKLNYRATISQNKLNLCFDCI